METTNKKPKRFAVVSFPEENGTVAVVPVKWLLSSENGDVICMWPAPKVTPSQLKKLVKDERAPDRKNWEYHQAEVKHRSKSYERAEDAMRSFMYKGDVAEFSADTEADCSLSFTSEIQPGVDSRGLLPDVRFLPAATSTQSMLQENEGGRSVIMDINCTSCNEMEKKLNMQATELELIKKNTLDIMLTLQHVVTTLSQVAKGTPQLEAFTKLEKIEDLQNFDASLEEAKFFSNMVRYFGAFGGKDKHAATRKILSVMMTNEFALQLNWMGGIKKRSIQEFKRVIQLIAASVRHNKIFQDVTLTEVEPWIARWLRYAGDRLGGKRKLQELENMDKENDARKRTITSNQEPPFLDDLY